MSSGLSKLKKKHFRVKHQKVKLFRANEPLLSVFMWGVNHTVRYFSLFLSLSLSSRHPAMYVCVYVLRLRVAFNSLNRLIHGL